MQDLLNTEAEDGRYRGIGMGEMMAAEAGMVEIADEGGGNQTYHRVEAFKDLPHREDIAMRRHS